MLPESDLATVLTIDLTRKRFSIERRPELFEASLGGAGVAIRLLEEHCPPGTDPLGPDNPIILTIGPLTGLFPLASKTVAMFKSPHTGNLGESHCGGRSAIAIRMAGYGAIVIKGASSIPIYVAIHGRDILFREATTLWGMSSNYTAGRIIREREPGAGIRTIMRIGKGGENLVSYSCVTTETYRHFGRLGLGAVFGSKKLKALVISGKSSQVITEKKRYRELYDTLYKGAVTSDVMRKYHDLGTAENILPLNSLGALPTRNLQTARFEHAHEISGESMAENYLGRRLACAHCPVACIHIAALREPYDDEPYFYKTSMISYDYEPIYALASMLGGKEVSGFLKLMDRIEALGIDVMSGGVALAWATEAMEKKLVTEKETGGIRLSWGAYENYLPFVDAIVEQKNDFYRALAQGVDKAAALYGGEDFALSFGGNEMPGYHTGPAAHLGFLVGTRHSHLDNAGYSVDQKTPPGTTLSPKELAHKIIKEEQWRQILSSLVICFFARGLYKPDMVRETLDVAGFPLSLEDIDRIGEETYRRKYAFKFREGFSLDSIRIPRRIFETPSPAGPFEETYLRDAIAAVRQYLAGEK